MIALRAIGHEDTKTQRKVTTDFTDCTEEICHEWTRIYFATEFTEYTEGFSRNILVYAYILI